jgi:hypothetical protein
MNSQFIISTVKMWLLSSRHFHLYHPPRPAASLRIMSSQGVPSPAELENLGVFFVGFIAATFLYGVTFFRESSYSLLRNTSHHGLYQTPAESYIYYSRYPNDSRWIKVLVCPFCLFNDSLSNVPLCRRFCQ